MKGIDARRRARPLRLLCATVLAAALPTFLAPPALAQSADVSPLVKAYPDFLTGVEGGMLVWKDGTRMPVDDGRGVKSFEALLDQPDLKDLFAMRYPLGRKGLAPARDFDPGRVRSAALFDKMYGNCLIGDVRKSFVSVPWLPTRANAKVLVSNINGAADSLRKVSLELDRLPETFLPFLHPTAGTYNCRPIAGTKRLSAHGYGIAIDIATKSSHYWQWTKPDAAGLYPYKNAIPWEIVEIFERHGWIWGGKWYHYDTMHFEYRPELIAAGE